MEATAPVLSEMKAQQRIEGAGFAAQLLVSEFNDRIQVLSYEAREPGALAQALKEKALENGFGKVFLKASEGDREALEASGMTAEATISGYFDGRPAAVMSAFTDPDRVERPFATEQEAILTSIRSRPADPSLPDLPDGYRLSVASAEDVDELAALYRTVFASYPFPIMNPEYLKATMATHVVYRIVRDGEGEVVAAASAEMSGQHRNAEMTDFATLPSQRGLGLAQHLLAALEKDMHRRDVPNLYTIARARSAGMNRVFYNRHYEMTGTLVNNCHIAGRFEDMHVWCRQPSVSV